MPENETDQMKIYPAFEIEMPENETDRDGGLAPVFERKR